MILRFSLCIALLAPACLFAQTKKTDLLILGTDHYSQLYQSGQPLTDVLHPQRQQEIESLASSLARFRPDVVLVEVLPERQPRIDSLYAQYRADALRTDTLEEGRSEVYQLAFRIGRRLGLPRIHGVNAPGGTSQGILDNGDNIALYKQEGLDLRAFVLEQKKAFGENRLTVGSYTAFINRPDTYNRVYRLRYLTPARVTNGTFRNPDAMVDTAFVNPKYIGAELISVFKKRDYKIYSNIVTTQMKTGAKRILLVIGAAHVGSLRSIFRDDSEYRLVEARGFLPE